MSQRDGSLIRRKQEQWAREREEEKNSAWFPFGAPGCGSPNRKYYSRGEEAPASGSQNSVSSGANKYADTSSQGSYSSTDYYSREMGRRSRSRSHSRSNRHHHKSSRHRDRSPSHEELGGGRIFVNPRFGVPQQPSSSLSSALPPSASYILQENERLEQANHSLKSENYALVERLRQLEAVASQGITMKSQLGEAKEDVERQRIVNATLEMNLRTATQKSAYHEDINKKLNGQLNMLSSENKSLKARIQQVEMSHSTVQEHADILGSRNEVLSRKVEEMLAKVRQVTDERDFARREEGKYLQEVVDFRRRLENAQRDLDKERELVRRHSDLETAWRGERQKLLDQISSDAEKNLNEKKILARRIKNDEKTLADLEEKLKKAQDVETMYETVKKTMNLVKEEYASQISILTTRLDEAEKRQRSH